MFKTATEAADWIQGARYKGQKNGLENMRALLTALGNPQNQFRSVHIAGTNGKGSTAAYTESILRQAGYRTGMYTSPYLITSSTSGCLGDGQAHSRRGLISLTAASVRLRRRCWKRTSSHHL